MRRPFIAGNWKMNTDPASAVALVEALSAGIDGEAACDVAFAPPFICLPAAHAAILKTGKPFLLAAQNVHWEASGAYTGEVSPAMLKAVGCRVVIVGHSERRRYFGETDEGVNRRLRAALAGGLDVIVCVGERLEEREADRTEAVVVGQLSRALEGISAEEMARVTVAYEPVWAIGTGRTATPDQAQAASALIRGRIGRRFSEAVAAAARIQYGGSVKAGNIDDLMACPDVDGALVGGASLKAEEFARIVRFHAG